MARYAVENLISSQMPVLHRLPCPSYPGMDPLTLSRMIDIGEHADFVSAFRIARDDYRALPCFFCCPRHGRDY